MSNPDVGEALSWDNLADLYDEQPRSRPARTLPMEAVFKWAENQKDKFWVHPEEDTIHLIKESNDQEG
jgi:hypothetical protein